MAPKWQGLTLGGLPCSAGPGAASRPRACCGCSEGAGRPPAPRPVLRGPGQRLPCLWGTWCGEHGGHSQGIHLHCLSFLSEGTGSEVPRGAQVWALCCYYYYFLTPLLSSLPYCINSFLLKSVLNLDIQSVFL